MILHSKKVSLVEENKKFMNKVLIILSLVLGLSFLGHTQQSDYKLVEQTLFYYLDGGTNNDFATLKKAFHPSATMKFIGAEYKEVNALEFFKKGMKPGPKQNRITRIKNISISGKAASAQLEIEYDTFSFIDYMNLLKIEGTWKIVGKIFYKRMKINE